LRLIPNLQVWRPADKAETLAAWATALRRRQAPTALVLTRQGLPDQPRNSQQLADISRGGYVLRDASNGKVDAVIMASGSEVGLAVSAAEALEADGLGIRVISMPNPDLFESQDADYRESVLPKAVKARVAIEAGVSPYWRHLVGDHGQVIGMDRFGASAPAEDLFREFGFTVENVVAAVRTVVG